MLSQLPPYILYLLPFSLYLPPSLQNKTCGLSPFIPSLPIFNTLYTYPFRTFFKSFFQINPLFQFIFLILRGRWGISFRVKGRSPERRNEIPSLFVALATKLFCRNDKTTKFLFILRFCRFVGFVAVLTVLSFWQFQLKILIKLPI